MFGWGHEDALHKLAGHVAGHGGQLLQIDQRLARIEESQAAAAAQMASLGTSATNVLYGLLISVIAAMLTGIGGYFLVTAKISRPPAVIVHDGQAAPGGGGEGSTCNRPHYRPAGPGRQPIVEI
jgi:hypothetical protein